MGNPAFLLERRCHIISRVVSTLVRKGKSALKPALLRLEKLKGSPLHAVVGISLFSLLSVEMGSIGGFGYATENSVPLATNGDEVGGLSDTSDGQWHLQAALGLRDRGPWGIGGNEWIYGFWPPGMATLNLVVLWMETLTRLPYMFLMVLTTALIWSLILTRIFVYFENRRFGFGFGFLLVFGLSNLFDPMVTTYILYPDALGTGFFALAALELMRATPDRNKRSGLYLRAAFFFSLAMHFRATFETISVFLILVSLVLVLGQTLLPKVLSIRLAPWRLEPARSVLIVGALSQLLTVPWRLIAGTFVRPGDFRWVAILDNSWGLRWTPAENFSEAGQYFVRGNGNFGCLNDPVRCEEIRVLEEISASPYSGQGTFSQDDFRDLLIQSFFEKPFTYVSERISTLLYGFFSETWTQFQGDLAILESTLLFVGIFLSMYLLARRPESDFGGVLMTVLSIAGLTGILLFFHMESRYFLPVKFLILILLFYGLSKRIVFRDGRLAGRQGTKPINLESL